MTDFLRRVPRHLLIRIGYLAAGLKFGSLWLLQGDGSPWEHALHLLVLMAALMAAADVLRRCAARRGRQVNHHAIGRFLLAKVGLVGLAVTAGLLLEVRVAHADLVVGLAIFAVVAVAGPSLHPWLMKSHPAPINNHPASPATAVLAPAAR